MKNSKFSKMLKENAKKITIKVKDEERSLHSLTEETVENLVATNADSIIPASTTEVAEESLGTKSLGIGITYSRMPFSMYEFAIKHGTAKQTMVLTLEAENYTKILNCSLEDLDVLSSRTNIQMIMDKMPAKVVKKLENFAENEEGKNDAFVLKIPNIVLFYDTIKKKEVSPAKLFDLVVVLVRTKKSISKLKRKNPDLFKNLCSSVVEQTVSVMANMGITCSHIRMDSLFYEDPHVYASNWVKSLTENDAAQKILERVIFCTNDVDTLAQFNAQIRAELVNNKLFDAI